MILGAQRKPSIQICQFLLFFFSVLATENLQSRLFLNFEFSFFTKFHQWKKKQWIELWTTTYVLHWYLRLMREMLIWKLFFFVSISWYFSCRVGSCTGGVSWGRTIWGCSPTSGEPMSKNQCCPVISFWTENEY
jgi:hypothetical protein